MKIKALHILYNMSFYLMKVDSVLKSVWVTIDCILCKREGPRIGLVSKILTKFANRKKLSLSTKNSLPTTCIYLICLSLRPAPPCCDPDLRINPAHGDLRSACIYLTASEKSLVVGRVEKTRKQ